ncbi:hypothetical protein ACQ0QQ_00245 [Lysinibacillus sphaericus]
MADKKNRTEAQNRLETANEHDRNNENARAAAELKQETPRINTDNL